MLAALDLDQKMRMEVDTLDYAIKRVLSMECEDRKWWPVAFLLKSLNEIERNYEIHNKKLYLSRFDFTLKHVLGTKMGKADRLSKRLDWKVGVKKWQ